jgi:hypothetical protein
MRIGLNIDDMTTQTGHGCFAGTLIDGARMYAAAADAVNDKLPNALHVLSHLLGMSAELALKSYLKHHDVPTSELRKLGHDLGAIYRRAQEFGLLYTGSRNIRLNVLSANYCERIFAYPEEAQLVVITPRCLREIVHELIADVFEVVKGKEVLNELEKQPGLTIQSEYPEDVNPSSWAVK